MVQGLPRRNKPKKPNRCGQLWHGRQHRRCYFPPPEEGDSKAGRRGAGEAASAKSQTQKAKTQKQPPRPAEAPLHGMGIKAKSVGGVCHQRRGITPPPRRGLGRCRATGYSPKSAHSPSTRVLTAASITIGVPHSRWVSPVHLLVASKPILPPSPDTGLAKSR